MLTLLYADIISPSSYSTWLDLFLQVFKWSLNINLSMFINSKDTAGMQPEKCWPVISDSIYKNKYFEVLLFPSEQSKSGTISAFACQKVRVSFWIQMTLQDVFLSVTC